MSLLAATLDSTADGILVVNGDGRVTTCNRTFAELWRIPPALLATHDDERLIDHVADQVADPDAFRRKVRDVYAHPEAVTKDELLFKDGRVFERYSMPQRLDGRIIGRVWSFRDVTDRRRAEARLADSEARLRAIIHSEPECVKLMAADGTLLEMNPAGLAMLEADRADQVVGQNALPIVVAADRDAFSELLARVFRGESGLLEFGVVGLKGTPRRLEMRAVPLRDPAGTVTAVLAVTRDVTERRRSAEILRQSEERFRALVENSSDSIALVSRDGRILFTTGAGPRSLGEGPDTAVGRHMFERVHAEDIPLLQSTFTELLRQPGAVRTVECRARNLDGSWRWLEAVAVNRLDDASVGAVVVNYRDITHRKEAEQRVRTSEAELRALFAAMTDVILVLDAQGRYIKIAPSSPELLYRPAPELLGRTLHDVLPKARADWFLNEVRTALAERRTRRVEYTMPIGNDEVWFGAAITPMLADQVVWVARDITDRKRSERLQAATYRISEAANAASNLRELLGQIHDIVGELMPAKNFYVALVDEETATLSFPYFVDEQDPDFPPKPLGKGLTEYVYRTGEPLLATPDVYNALVRRGEVELIGAPSIDWVGVPLKSGDKTIGVVVAQSYTEGVRYGEIERNILQFVSSQIARAIERRRAAEQLEQSEVKYRQLFEANPEAVWVYDGETLKFLAVNAAAVARYGYAQDEFAGLTQRDIRAPDEIAQLDREVARSLQGPHHIGGVRHRTRDGRLLDVELQVHPIEFGGRRAVLVLARDVTERHRLEEQLRQAQKMEAVGQLAGGIAHDFNNILTAILGTTQLLMRDVAAEHPMRDDLEEIRKAATRAADLTRQLLAYSRRQVLAPKLLELNAVIANLQPMLRRLIGEDIQLATALAPDLASVRADPSQLEQVILNLAVNARDAMPNGGRLTIETSNVVLDEAYAREHPSVVPGTYVLLGVTDSGVGMDPDTKAHLFEPFFTTKPPGQGTGLGLATVYGVVKQSGGYVWVYSELGRGSSFKVYLPQVEGRVEPGAIPIPAPRPRHTGETVLLVEDEPAVRLFARKALELAGYQVLVAPDGMEALRLAEQHSGPIQLLLTDVVMPGMSGRMLAERLCQQRPTLKVLYTSGYTDDAIVRHGVLDASAAFLQKPFSPETLERKIRDVLDH